MELQKIYSDDIGLLTAFAESRIGGRPENQDSYGWQNTDFGYLVTVCDGMGGGPGGKTASTIAVQEIVAGISEASKEDEVSNVIKKAVMRANMAVIEAGNETPRLKGMGSTATVLLISEKSAFIAHVGDSRVYQVRGGRKIFRTFDHSMVFEMVANGVITEEQARLSAQSNIITRALGIHPDIEVDVQEVAYEKGDRFILCSDGIHGTMPEKELVKLFSSKKSKLGVLTDDIATYVDNIGHSSGGGHDNLTIAMIETNINSKLKPKMSRNTKYTIIGLVALVILSIALNVSQFVKAGNSDEANLQKTLDSVMVVASQKSDSIKLLNDSVARISDSVKVMNNKINSIKIITNK